MSAESVRCLRREVFVTACCAQACFMCSPLTDTVARAPTCGCRSAATMRSSDAQRKVQKDYGEIPYLAAAAGQTAFAVRLLISSPQVRLPAGVER